jgi:predicted TIM-barrel fold metal-dependent hydrolase
MVGHREGMRRRRFLASLAGGIAAACGAPAAVPSAPASRAASPSPTPAAPATPSPLPATASPTAAASCSRDASGHVLFVDTHAHLDGLTRGGADYAGAIDAALAQYDVNSAKIGIVMAPPTPPGQGAGAYDYTDYEAACKKRRPRVAFLGGGGTLNPMIQQAIAAGSVSTDLESRFRSAAAQILAAGAVGFGETAAEHLSFNPKHPYESAPPDHPLFLLLAEIAADKGVLIDFHMFPVTREGAPTPPAFLQLSPNNPRTLHENISRFERLLDHAPSAKIVWDHAGDTFTGCGDATLAGDLLGRHANLYLQLKANAGTGLPQTLVTPAGAISAGWLSVIRAFPDRIVLGGDNFWPAPGALLGFQRPEQDVPALRALVDHVPNELVCRVASDNALRIYSLA